jgi:hypothetical protein
MPNGRINKMAHLQETKFFPGVGFEVLTAASTKMTVFWVVALTMEAARTSETLVNFYQTTWRYNPATQKTAFVKFLPIFGLRNVHY